MNCISAVLGLWRACMCGGYGDQHPAHTLQVTDGEQLSALLPAASHGGLPQAVPGRAQEFRA